MKSRQILSLILVAISIPALAETAYIPPNSPQVAITQAANGQNIDYRSAGNGQPSTTNFKGGSWTYSKDGPRTVQFNNVKATAGTVTATKTNPTTFTGTYGEKAHGRVSTQTTATPSTLGKAMGGYVAGSVVGSVLTSEEAKLAAKSAGSGDYGTAALSAAAAFDVFGIGKGINGLKEAFLQGQAQKTQQFIAAKEAAQGEMPAGYNPHHKDVFLGFHNDSLVYIHSGSTMVVGHNSATNTYDFKAFFGSEGFRIVHSVPADGGRVSVKQVPNDPLLWEKPVTVEDILLTQAEMQNIANQYLEDLLKNQNVNNEQLKELVNALWASGALNANNTQTAVVGDAAANTFLSSPYTPAGSDTAQQTQFIVNNNGDVITNIIKRPDLAAHTSQAPTRQQVGENTANHAQSQTQAPKEQATEKSPDVCAMNPNSLMCAEMGSADYEDISLPDNTIDIGVKYVPYFNSTGSCPQDIAMSWMGATFQFSYAPVCKIASLLNPVFQFVGMAYAAAIAFAAVREL